MLEEVLNTYKRAAKGINLSDEECYNKYQETQNEKYLAALISKYFGCVYKLKNKTAASFEECYEQYIETILNIVNNPLPDNFNFQHTLFTQMKWAMGHMNHKLLINGKHSANTNALSMDSLVSESDGKEYGDMLFPYEPPSTRVEDLINELLEKDKTVEAAIIYCEVYYCNDQTVPWSIMYDKKFIADFEETYHTKLYLPEPSQLKVQTKKLLYSLRKEEEH